MNWRSFLNYKDFRFWLVLLTVVRLYGITLPPLEHQHPWRQADGLMIARNFLETNANILYPRVDIAGDHTGITGSEFPILNYLIYLIAAVFGYAHWHGRLIVLIVSGCGSYYFYKLIRNYFGERAAFNAAIILTASYWFSYSRKILPDCFAASLCIIALYFALQYLENRRPLHLLLYFTLGSLGGLSKISACVLLAIVPVLVVSLRFPIYNRAYVAAASVAILAVVCGWYFVWVPHLNKTFGFGDHFTSGCPLWSMGWEEIKANFAAVMRRLFIVPMKYLGFAAFLISFIYVIVKRRWSVLALFIIPYLAFLVIILKTGKSIVHDQYYVLTSIPVLAFMAGYGLSQLTHQAGMYLLLIAIAVENIGDQVYDFRIHKMNAPLASLEQIADSVSQRQDLFIINSGTHCPTIMYFAHRRGWTVTPQAIQDKSLLESVKKKGCKYVLICKEMYHENYDVVLDLPQLFESADFRIYSLERPDFATGKE